MRHVASLPTSRRHPPSGRRIACQLQCTREESKQPLAAQDSSNMNAPVRLLSRTCLAMAIVAALAGCTYRYDASGNKIYGWQYGQDNQRDIDYSNPRLPILPKSRPSMELWPIPSPYEFNDLSRYSFLDDRINPTIIRVGDNAACAACSESTARLALLATRADALDRGGATTVR
jgi:hypothetical protein